MTDADREEIARIAEEVANRQEDDRDYNAWTMFARMLRDGVPQRPDPKPRSTTQ